MRVKAIDIDWDTDGRKVPELPKECVIDVDCQDEAELDYMLADALSDRFGYCVNAVDYVLLTT